jgi:hypothetical protein
MESEQPSTDQLALAEIRAMTDKFLAAERQLTKQLQTAWAQGSDKGMSMPEREFQKRARARAEQLLDGDAVNENLAITVAETKPKRKTLGERLLPPKKDGPSEPGVPHLHVERAAVRLVLDGLNNQSLAAEAGAAVDRAVQLGAQWKSLVREWVLAALRWQAVEARAQAFKDAAGPNVLQALLRGDLAIGGGAEIDLRAFDSWRLAVSADDVATGAVDAGFLSRREVDAAKRGRGDA